VSGDDNINHSSFSLRTLIVPPRIHDLLFPFHLHFHTLMPVFPFLNFVSSHAKTFLHPVLFWEVFPTPNNPMPRWIIKSFSPSPLFSPLPPLIFSNLSFFPGFSFFLFLLLSRRVVPSPSPSSPSPLPNSRPWSSSQTLPPPGRLSVDLPSAVTPLQVTVFPSQKSPETPPFSSPFPANPGFTLLYLMDTFFFFLCGLLPPSVTTSPRAQCHFPFCA